MLPVQKLLQNLKLSEKRKLIHYKAADQIFNFSFPKKVKKTTFIIVRTDEVKRLLNLIQASAAQVKLHTFIFIFMLLRQLFRFSLNFSSYHHPMIFVWLFVRFGCCVIGHNLFG